MGKQFGIVTGAIYGKHYTLAADGRVIPVVRGGADDDGMTLEQLITMVEQAEGDLSALSATQVGELRDSTYEAFQSVRPNVASDNADGIAALTRVAEAIGTLDTYLAQPEVVQALADEQAAAAQAAADAQALLDGVQPRQTSTGDDDGAGGGDGGGDDGSGGGDDGAGGGDDGGSQSAAGGRQTASARPPLDALGGGLGGTGGGDDGSADRFAPVPQRILASAGAQADGSLRVGQELTLEALGEAMEMQHVALQTLASPDQLDRDSIHINAKGRVSGVGGAKHYLGVIPIAEKPGVVIAEAGQASHGGTDLIERATQAFIAHRDAMDAENVRRIASGGDCVMDQPDFSIKVIGDTGTCFADSMPTVATMRPLAFYPWFKINQANGATGTGSRPADGIGFVTAEQDAAGYGDPDIEEGEPGAIPEDGAAYKSCIHIDCPDEPLRCTNEAVYKCVTMGNFQAQSHPEYVEAFQKYMDVWFDIERDNHALAKFVAAATDAGQVINHSEVTFGAVSSLKDVLTRLVVAERSARHAPNLGWNVVAPDWFGDYLVTDILRTTFGGLERLRTSRQQAMALASTDGIRFSTYCTEAGPTVGAGTNSRMVWQPISNAVPSWPNKVRLLVYPDGAMFKKTGNQLRFGLRETLLKSNDFGMFMELFENVCFRDAPFVLDLRLCQNGATGAPVALVCN